MTSRACVLAVALMVVSAPADALKLPDLKGRPGEDLGLVADWLAEIHADMANATKAVPRDCAATLAKFQGRPVVTSNKNLGKRGKRMRGVFQLTNAAATKFCEEVALVQNVIVKDATLFSTMIRDVGLFADTSRGPDVATFGLAQADKCDAAVAALVTAKVPANHPFVLADDKKRVVVRTVGQLKGRVCTATRTAANRYAKKLDAEKKAFEARVAASGLSGDKLDWFRHYTGKVFLAGGERPKDLKKLVAADVWFGYAKGDQPDRDGKYRFNVRRYTFTGDKLQTTTDTEHWEPASFEGAIGSVMK